MTNRLTLTIAWRYLVSKKSTNAINIITAVSMLGMAVGAMALVLVLSVFNGFEGLVISLYSKFTPDFQITSSQAKVFSISEEKLKQLRSLAGVENVSEVLQEKGLLRFKDREYIATIRGVDENFTLVTGIGNMTSAGKFVLETDEEDFMVLGAGVKAAIAADLSEKLDPIALMLPARGKQSTGLLPTDAFKRRFLFPSGFVSVQQEFDYEFVFVSLNIMREMLKYTDEVTSVEIKLNPTISAEQVRKELQQVMGSDFYIKDKWQQDEHLFKVMRTENFVTYVILTFILIIASFNIIGSLTMIIMEKKKDISILRAMGASQQNIMKLFLAEGIMIALVGGGIGLLIAFVLSLIQVQFGILELGGSGTFVISAYPVDIRLFNYLLVLFTIIVISVFASIYPALKAAKAALVLNQK